VKYVICHGALVRPAAKFPRGATAIGFYVNRLGELLPQSATAPIIQQNQRPAMYVDSPNCSEMALTPLSPEDRASIRMSLGPHADSPDIILLGESKTLSVLVAELGQDELRMITCTGAQGAPRTVVTEEVLPGIRMESRPPRMAERPEQQELDHISSQLVYKRRISAQSVAAYLGELGEKSAALWQMGPVTNAIMTEWAVTQRTAITGEPNSWVDTIYQIVTMRDGLAAFFADTRWSQFPDFFADAKARLALVHGYLTVWPDCVRRFAVIYEQNPRFDTVRHYLNHPGIDNGVRTNVRRYEKILLAWQWQAALKPDDITTWHNYLTAVQALDAGELAGLRLLANVDDTASWMATCAVGWPDFAGQWTVVRSRYDATVAPLLVEQSQRNGTLWNLLNPPANQPMAETYADAMDFAPTDANTVGQVPAGNPKLRCVTCGSDTVHEAVSEDTASRDHQGVRVCVGCGALIGSYDNFAGFACTGCRTIAMAHTGCLAT
jgi:hypothetical protein